jgi:repressor LexA
MVAMGSCLSWWWWWVSGEQVFFLDFHHSEQVFVVQPPRKPKPSMGLRGTSEKPEHVFDLGGEQAYAQRMTNDNTNPIDRLGDRQRKILVFIDQCMRDRGYPPSVREIGEAVGLSSSATVHNHLNTLQELGYLRRDPTKPRALEVRYDASSGVTMERRPAKYIPLVGEVAAGVNVLAQENVEDLVPLPMDFTGDGELFMLKIRGESMIEAGILDGDFVVCRQQNVARNGDVVVVGIPGDEATVKTFKRDGNKVVLVPSNSTMKPLVFDASEVSIFGKVVTVLRRL